ncbi:hypothetical protein ACW5R3_07325 [Bizionia sp. KMM 8389]
MSPVINKYNFGSLAFYENYVIAVMNEGVTVTIALNQKLYELARNFFGNKPFVYITYRKNSYSVDPRVYFETPKLKTLVGFAVVLTDLSKIDNTDFERNFSSLPFKRFNSIKEAKTWANKICPK